MQQGGEARHRGIPPPKGGTDLLRRRIQPLRRQPAERVGGSVCVAVGKDVQQAWVGTEVGHEAELDLAEVGCGGRQVGDAGGRGSAMKEI